MFEDLTKFNKNIKWLKQLYRNNKERFVTNNIREKKFATNNTNNKKIKINNISNKKIVTSNKRSRKKRTTNILNSRE